MDLRLVLHQGVLFAHVIAFAITLSAVLREDMRWLRHRRIEPARLQHTMRTVTIGLVALWLTGLALWALTPAPGHQALAWNAKLSAKLVVVSLLTLNGWALHAWVFPALQEQSLMDNLARRLPAMLGAFSSASWVYASFVGVARPLSGVLSFADFMALYAISLGLALLLALRVWRVRAPAPRPPATTGGPAKLSTTSR
jgi:hypothetical protein